jgi:hypothetical protein
MIKQPSLQQNIITKYTFTRGDNLNIVNTDTGFIHYYEDEVFSHIEWERTTGNLKLNFSNGSQTVVASKCSIYNSQYGIPISKEHMKLFVSSWEQGLFCYDAITGDLVWQLKMPRITKVFIFSDYVITQKYGESILKVDIRTGEVINQLRGKSIECFFNVTGNLLFVGRINRAFCLLDADQFRVVKKYNEMLINPRQCLSLLIQSVAIKDHALTIEGLEQYSNKNFSSKEQYRFTRLIDESVAWQDNVGENTAITRFD